MRPTFTFMKTTGLNKQYPFFSSFGTYAESCFTNSVVQISVLTWKPTRGEMMCTQLHVCHKFSQKTQRGDWMIPAASWPDTIFLHSQHPVWCPEKTNHAVNVTLILLNCFELNFPLIFCRSPTMGAVASGAENVVKLWSRSNLCSRRFCRFAHSGYIRETKNWMRGFFYVNDGVWIFDGRAERTSLIIFFGTVLSRSTVSVQFSSWNGELSKFLRLAFALATWVCSSIPWTYNLWAQLIVKGPTIMVLSFHFIVHVSYSAFSIITSDSIPASWYYQVPFFSYSHGIPGASFQDVIGQAFAAHPLELRCQAKCPEIQWRSVPLQEPVGDGEGSMVGTPKRDGVQKEEMMKIWMIFWGFSRLESRSYWVGVAECKIRLELDRLPRRNVKNGSHWIEFWGSVRWQCG